MKTSELEQFLHQEVELAFWDELKEEHIIYEGRIIDIDQKSRSAIIKRTGGFSLLDIQEIDRIFQIERKISNPYYKCEN
ncbi:hypothetical protein HN681_04400 [archaeon]|jgi:hypothetical protein|nr:hypothetical protein [archaeon]MBT3730645.1 hypothetical protein [archaeon]MBT4669547.1 hypothetical protein [archaeon]MBT5030304.1 hypothetical protein [archaeon]MBT5288403.1 hypothetical protein [archaeon]